MAVTLRGELLDAWGIGFDDAARVDNDERWDDIEPLEVVNDRRLDVEYPFLVGLRFIRDHLKRYCYMR